MTDNDLLKELKNAAEIKREKLFNFLIGSSDSRSVSNFLPVIFRDKKHTAINNSFIVETEYPVVSKLITMPSRTIIESYISIILFAFVKYFLNKLYIKLFSKTFLSSKVPTFIKNLYN